MLDSWDTERWVNPMSSRAVEAVWATDGLSSIEKLVLLRMAECANDCGILFSPPKSTLARDCGCDLRSVHRVVSKLQSAGILTKIPIQDTRHLAYVIHMQEIENVDGRLVTVCHPVNLPVTLCHCMRQPVTVLGHEKCGNADFCLLSYIASITSREIQSTNKHQSTSLVLSPSLVSIPSRNHSTGVDVTTSLTPPTPLPPLPPHCNTDAANLSTGNDKKVPLSKKKSIDYSKSVEVPAELLAIKGFEEAWNDRCAQRYSRPKTRFPSERAVELELRELCKAIDPVMALERATAAGWQGLCLKTWERRENAPEGPKNPSVWDMMERLDQE